MFKVGEIPRATCLDANFHAVWVQRSNVYGGIW